MKRLQVLRESLYLETKMLKAQQEFSFLTQEKVCKEGCNSCCHYPFSILFSEAILLLRHLKKKNLWTAKVKEQCKVHHELTKGITETVWFLSLIPCPLLTPKGICSAYDERPMVCRGVLSKRDPYYCHPHNFSSEKGPELNTEIFIDFVSKIKPKTEQAELPWIFGSVGLMLLLADEFENGAPLMETIRKLCGLVYEQMQHLW